MFSSDGKSQTYRGSPALPEGIGEYLLDYPEELAQMRSADKPDGQPGS
jgi:hypothetical protein